MPVRWHLQTPIPTFSNEAPAEWRHAVAPNIIKSQTNCWYFCGYQMRLIDIAFRRTNRPGKYADEHGLYLHVTPTGRKYWRCAYRFAGKQKSLALRIYPDTSLARARELHHEAKVLLAEGADVGHRKNAAKLYLAEDWLGRQMLKDITRDKLRLWLARASTRRRLIRLVP